MRAIALVFCFGVCGCNRDNALLIAPLDLAPVVNVDCPAGAVFCEDFERGDTSRWDAENASGASAIVDGLQPRGGKFALHVTVTGRSWAYLVKRLSAPGTLYARFWVKPISVGDDELSLLALSLGGSEGPSVRTSGPRIGRSEFPGGTWALGDVSRVDTIASEAGVALGAWSCVELIPDDPSPVWVAPKLSRRRGGGRQPRRLPLT